MKCWRKGILIACESVHTTYPEKINPLVAGDTSRIVHVQWTGLTCPQIHAQGLVCFFHKVVQ